MKLAFLTILLAAGWQLPAQELTARQLFYQKDDAPAKPAAQPAVPAPKPAPKKVAKKSAPKPTPPPPQDAAATPASTPAPAETAPAAAPVIATNAAYVQSTSPLGLRYALVQVVNGAEREVSPQSSFHSGDMVRVKIEGNRNGYLYVIARGSSGNWKPLFPAPDINGGENRVAPHQRYTLPSASQAFTFDEQPGQEALFLIFSAEPVRDIDSMFPTLIQSGNSEKPPAAAPAILTASAAPITDSFVSRMRQTYSRDLIVQTVTPTAPDAQSSDPMENAVYVVEKSGRPLVADIRLEHR